MEKKYKLPFLLLILGIIFSCNNKPSNKVNEPKTVDIVSDSTAESITSNEKEVIDSTSTQNAASLAAINSKLTKKPQTFSLKTSNDTIIRCIEGTRIKISANSFETEKGTDVKGSVLLSVTEYYKLSDILLARLSTTSNGRLLETGGMLYVSATSNGEKCRLKKGQNIALEFPRKEEKMGMQLFTGTWQNENKIDWKTDDSTIDFDCTYPQIEESAEFPGGAPLLYKFISRNFIFPEDISENSSGKIYVGFIVDAEGNVKNERIQRGLSKELDEAALNVVRKFPKFIPAKINGVAIKTDISLPINISIGDDNSSTISSFGPSNTKNSRLKKNFEKNQNDKTVQNASTDQINAYLFSATKLGWINCDRFLDISPSSVINYAVNVGNGEQATLSVVFHRYKSIMNDYSGATNEFLFKKIPKNQVVTLVAIKYENNQLQLAVTERKTSSSITNDLVFKPVTMETLKTEMKKLDRFTF